MTSSVNITRAEAQQRSTLIKAHSYRVLVDLSGRGVDGNPLNSPEVNFLATTTVHFSSGSGSTWIDMIADEMVEATLDGVALPLEAHDGVRLFFDVNEGDHELIVTAIARYSRTGEGLHRFVDPADQKIYLYTQFETADARRMFACFDQPDQKATFELSVIAPHHWKVYSNSPTQKPSALSDDLARWDFEPTKPISTYITALVAGEFHVHSGSVQSVKGKLGADLVCRQSVAEFLDADRLLETTQRGFDVYEKAFDCAYPFEKYDQLFLPEYNAGAMENAGCVTIRDEYLYRSRVTAHEYSQRDNTVLHELAHMWFGDLVTMKWWDDLWLNESFAEWASTWCQAKIADVYGGSDPWTGFANHRKHWAYSTDQLPTTHPVAADMIDLETVDQNFDGITYAKGASVLKQLVAYVGEESFLSGLRSYFARYAWSNTEFSDLLGALEEASGRDLSHFAADWLATSGANIVSCHVEVDDNDHIVAATVHQSSVGEPVLRTHRMAIGLYDLVDDGVILRESIEVDISGEQTVIEQLSGLKCPDLLLLNDRDLGYVKVRLDERSLTTVRTHMAKIADPLARAVVWTSLWDSWRDAELSNEDYLSIILTGLEGEDHPGALLNQLAAARQAVSAYSDLQKRPALRARLTAGLAELLKGAEPGSDKQVSIADALIASVHSPAGGDLLTAWLNGEEIPQGLVIDQERRWSIVTSLARLGRIDRSVIDQEAIRDNTISGAEQAAGARAALNDHEAKEDAWRLATDDPSIPNGTHRSIAIHLFNFGQEEILDGFADRYLDVVTQIADSSGTWAQRGHIARQTVLLHLWPTPLADRDFCNRVREWMQSRSIPEQVRRVLSNQLDNSERALKAADFSSHS